MLFFAHGSKPSVAHILKLISTFSSWSGLTPSKSNSFLCNCDQDFIAWFDSLSIPRGSLLVKFLGVPLISSHLCVNDCMPLIEKITSRMNSWAFTLLSFAGRALLIKSVIYAIEAFWCNHFILSDSVHANIQSLLTRFLWKGNINHKGGSKVAWSTICLPREERGLGLKNMIDWNKAQIMHHLIQVISNSDTLWATWVRRLVIKNNHLWTLKVPTNCSWIWRKILKLRGVALQFVSYWIGNGSSISLWFDPW